MPPEKGDERVEGAGLASSTTFFRQSSVPWASFTNCQKKGGSLIPPRTTHRPLTEGNTTKVTEEIPTSRRHYDQTTTGVSNPRKKSGPTRSSHDAFTLLPRDELMFALRQTTPPSVEPRI